ncbi:hypothetical protein NUH87_28445 [Pseudomonas batumici]|uniref:hypothetical protein n=1 Tax=Pseudomonas batumici TaxID=226910 RepID=UPI0030D20035
MKITLDDAELLQKIKLADAVIAVVKAVLGNTPLNQRKEIERLDVDVLGDLNSYTRIGIAKQYFLEIGDKKRQLSQELQEKHKARFDNNYIRGGYSNKIVNHRPKVVVASLHEEERGVCQDYASLAYALLREYLPASEKVSYIYSKSIVHFYCAIGDFDVRNASNKIIVVDPWYTKAQAILWQHSHHKAQNFGGAVIYCKPGKASRDVATDPPSTEYAVRLIASARHKFEETAKSCRLRFDRTLEGRLGKGEYYEEDPRALDTQAYAHALNRNNSSQYGNNVYTYKDNSRLVEYIAPD